MAIYDTAGLENATTILDLVIYANQVTSGSDMFTSEGILIGGFMIVIFAIISMAYSKRGLVQALFTSSFICFILSIFLRIAELVSFLLVLGFGLTLAISGWMLVLERKSQN